LWPLILSYSELSVQMIVFDEELRSYRARGPFERAPRSRPLPAYYDRRHYGRRHYRGCYTRKLWDPWYGRRVKVGYCSILDSR
jgi:hypothetical protein